MSNVQRIDGTTTSHPITCHGCDEDAERGCHCLTERSILDRFAEASHRLLVKGNDPARSDLSRAHSRRLARLRLGHCIELKEQRERERAGWRAFRKAVIHRTPSRYSARRDADMLGFMMEDAVEGNWCPMRSVERAAEAFGRPVAYVRDLRARCLRAMEGHPVELPVALTASRRAA